MVSVVGGLTGLQVEPGEVTCSTMKPTTLAQRLGTTAHLSPLLMKARRLGLRDPEDLERLAVSRGLRYYSNGVEDKSLKEKPTSSGRTSEELSTVAFSNEELGLALMSLCLPFSQLRLRMGAAMISADDVSPVRLTRLATQERCESVVAHVANCGKRVEPNSPFWPAVMKGLSNVTVYPPDLLPHLTRFVAMTGVTRRGKETIMQWIRPRCS